MYVHIETEATCYCVKGYFMAATRRHDDDHDNNNHFALLLHVVCIHKKSDVSAHKYTKYYVCMCFFFIMMSH